MKRLITIALSIILALIVAVPMASGQSSDTNHSAIFKDQTRGLPTTLAAGLDQPTDSQHITVVTRNLYLGANLDQAIAAIFSGNPDAIIQAATATWASLVATNFPERAEVLADRSRTPSHSWLVFRRCRFTVPVPPIPSPKARCRRSVSDSTIWRS